MELRGNLRLFVIVFLIHLQPGHSQTQDSLKCLNDFIRNITCVWDMRLTSSRHNMGPDATYTLFGEKQTAYRKIRLDPCDLRPVTQSDPALRACSLLLPDQKRFLNGDRYIIEVRFNGSSQETNITYKPDRNIKMHPPTKPRVDNHTVSWTMGNVSGKIYEYYCEVQYKNQGDPWESAFNVTLENKQHSLDLDIDRLVRGQGYQAKVRVRVPEHKSPHGTWSDWSPTASWKSTVGATPTPSPLPPGFQLVWFSEASGVLAAVVVVAVLVLTWLCSAHKPTRLYIVKKLMGRPLPNPSKFFPDLHSAQGKDFKLWLSPKFARESYLDSFLLPVHISPLEVTHTVDTIAPCRPAAASTDNKKMKMSSDLGSCASFSNRTYSLNLHLTLPTSGGALEPCAADSPYGPLVDHRKEERRGDAEEESDGEVGDGREERESGRGLGNLKDAESSDDGGEEAEGEAEGRGGEEEGDGDMGKDREEARLLGLLFGGTSVITGGNSLQMSPSYERVERLQDQHWHPKSPDSGVSSWGEDQESRESMGDPDGSAFANTGCGGHFGSNVFRFTSCSSPLPKPLPCFTQIPLTLPGLGMEPGPFTLDPMDLPGKILEDIALMTSSVTIEPSSGDYMAV